MNISDIADDYLIDVPSLRLKRTPVQLSTLVSAGPNLTPRADPILTP
jgi:hypothetical protein